MNGSYNVYMCRNCSAWNQAYPENPKLGNCLRLPVLTVADKTIGLLPASDWRREPKPTRDEEISVLRTTGDFGCTSFLPEWTNEPG